MKRWWILDGALGLAFAATALLLVFDDRAPVSHAELREQEEIHRSLVAGPTSTSTAPTPLCDTIQRREQSESSTGRRGPFHDGIGSDWIVIESIEPTDQTYDVTGTIRDGREIDEVIQFLDDRTGAAAIRALDEGHRVALLTGDLDRYIVGSPRNVGLALISPGPDHSFLIGRCAKSAFEEPLRGQLGERFDQVMWALPTTPEGDATYELIYQEPRPEPMIPPPPATTPTYEFSRMTFVVTSEVDHPDAHACFRSPELGWDERVKCIEPMQAPVRYLATVSDSRTMALWLSQDHTVPLPVELVGRLEIPMDIFESAERPAVRIHLIDVDKPGQTSFEILAWGDATTLDFVEDALWQSPFETLSPG
ncbi:MAG: hypothetical protein R8J94_08055 [Acidimicrobiia bacterium]|nr:hypothetical protein [Acidimicrobiia bacterium]